MSFTKRGFDMAIKPKRLQKGDMVGVIAPASPPNMEKLKRGIHFIKKLGLDVKLGSHLEKRMGYLAGTDEERLEDFHEMFANNKVKAIICARGGYGTARFASMIDYELIKKNPKIFWGYSDITFLHTAIHQKTGLVTFHGPMLGSDLGEEKVDPLSKQYFQQLFGTQIITYTNKISPLEVLVEGVASGPIVGGNLSILTSTLGTPFEIDTSGKLLLIEDVNEEPHVIDRMLNQLNMAGKFNNISGFLIGDFHNCSSRSEMAISLDEIINHYVNLANKPAIKGFKIGHCSPHISIPLGVCAVLNTFEKKLEVESGVIS
jgi:muramoyltetrapeptide carboxypeptidase